MASAMLRSGLLALVLARAGYALAGEALYRLPYDDGAAYTISQAPGGMMTTHRTRDSRHAVDFMMPAGTRPSCRYQAPSRTSVSNYRAVESAQTDSQRTPADRCPRP